MNIVTGEQIDCCNDFRKLQVFPMGIKIYLFYFLLEQMFVNNRKYILNWNSGYTSYKIKKLNLRQNNEWSQNGIMKHVIEWIKTFFIFIE